MTDDIPDQIRRWAKLCTEERAALLRAAAAECDAAVWLRAELATARAELAELREAVRAVHGVREVTW